MRRLTLCLAVLLAAVAAHAIAESRRVSQRLAGLERSVEVTDSAGQTLRAFPVADGVWRLPAAPQDVSPLYRKFLLAYEDKRFFAHHGVDALALARAAWQFATTGRIVSGASTITMQTVRLLFPERGHGAYYKLRQIEGALLLELTHDKQEILGTYLLLAPFGGNLQGVRAASLAYFGKEPANLSLGEAALLVALPRAPRRRPDRDPLLAREERSRVLGRMLAAGLLREDAARAADVEPMPDLRRSMPMHAPHLAQRLVAADRAGHRVATTIDGRLQKLVEPIVSAFRDRLYRQANLALLVVRNRDAAVLVHIGSAGILDPDRSGHIDYTRAVRSPGSALKPFVYGMAFETLLVHPDTIMADAPIHFGSYAPTNFDGEYSGLTTVREALRQSLNTTALTVLDALGPRTLVSRLRAVGVPLQLPGPDAEATPAVAVGGCGISLEGLVTLFAALANRGTVHPLRFRPADPVEPGKPLLRSDAAWAVADILASAQRPGGTVADQVEQPRRVAFKTGTSAGYRDAWAVGFTADYTVGVWIGRADAAPMPGQYGRTLAAPLVFQIFDQLPPSLGDPGGPPPPDSPLLPRADLPPRLARFARPGATSDQPVIDSPADGAQIVAPASGLLMHGHGGRPPWHWLADGRPVAPPSARTETTWLPRTAGQITLQLVDGDGQFSTASIWIDLAPRAPPP